MAIHAAANYRVRALGVTFSGRQAEWAQRAIADIGLAGRAQVRLPDHRDLTERNFDAISSIGVMEHFDSRQFGSHFASMASRLRSTGRMLNHCITRPADRERTRAGPLIDRHIFPDGELQGLGTVDAAIHDHGFEVRHSENLREHYARTLSHRSANLERSWPQALAEVGERSARAWRLYMAAPRVGFELGRIQVHQILAVKHRPNGCSGTAPRPNSDRRPADPEIRVNNNGFATGGVMIRRANPSVSSHLQG